MNNKCKYLNNKVVKIYRIKKFNNKLKRIIN